MKSNENKPVTSLFQLDNSNLLIENRLSIQEPSLEVKPINIIAPQIDLQKDDELEEELKDNITFLDVMRSSRNASRISAKNPYSLLRQPILKRFSNNLNLVFLLRVIPHLIILKE